MLPARALSLLLLPATLAGTAPAQASYRVVDCGILSGARGSNAFGINDRGDVAGVSTVGGWQAFLYTDAGGITPLGTLPGESGASARDVDELRQVVGESGTAAYRWSAATGMVDISGGQWTRANAISNGGVVAGTLDPGAFLSFTPFRYTPATGVVALTPGQNGRAKDVDEAGRVVGWASRAFRYDPASGLQLLPVPSLPRVFPGGINRKGVIAGVMSSLSGNTRRLFRYTAATGYQDLGTVGQDGFVHGINEHGVIVGRRDTGVPHAFAYRPGTGIQDLNTLIPAGSPWFLTHAKDVNGRGQIAALGYDNSRGMFRAVRLDPVRPTASSRRIASGCGGGTGAPLLDADPPVLGNTTTWSLTGAVPSSPAAFAYASGPPTPSPLPNGCTAYVDRSTMTSTPLRLTNGSGSMSATVPVPAAPAAVGLEVTVQAAVLVSGAGQRRVDVSNGEFLVVGH